MSPAAGSARSSWAVRAFVLVLASLATAPAAVFAQGGPGFLFKRPIASLSVRFGYSMPNAGSEIFQFIQDTLTVGTNAFDATAIGGDLAIRATERLDVGVGLAYSRATTRSEFRNWVGVDDLPIEQETRLVRLPLTASLKYYLMDRGRSVGSFAWIPARWSPYVGAGAGYMWYRFHQSGEFIDYETVDDPEGAVIFQDTFEFDGWTPTAQVLAGADVTLSTHLVLTGEARYGWASAPMGRQFEGFDDLDLSGLQATVGLSVRF